MSAGMRPDRPEDRPPGPGARRGDTGESPSHTGEGPSHTGESPSHTGKSPSRAGGSPGDAGERPIHPDELLVMAYVDGELSAPERADLEVRLAREPALARELAAQRGLNVLAREVAPREPEDHEWARISGAPLGRAHRALGWALVVVGPLLAIVLLEGYVWSSGASAPVKWAVSIAVAAAVLYFVLSLRARLLTRPYDPYTGIRR